MKLEVIDCSNIKELTNDLDRLHLDGWYFRGQADEAWPLLPTVWRDEILINRFEKKISPEKYAGLKSTIRNNLDKNEELKKLDVENILKWAVRVKYENNLLTRFYFEANNAGLPISECVFRSQSNTDYGTSRTLITLLPERSLRFLPNADYASDRTLISV